MRLRYTGAQATTFTTVGAVEPGAEFTVPDDQAEGFLRRPDIKEVPPAAPASRPRKPARPASTEHTDAAAAVLEEGESRAVPDDH